MHGSRARTIAAAVAVVAVVAGGSLACRARAVACAGRPAAGARAWRSRRRSRRLARAPCGRADRRHLSRAGRGISRPRVGRRSVRRLSRDGDRAGRGVHDGGDDRGRGARAGAARMGAARPAADRGRDRSPLRDGSHPRDGRAVRGLRRRDRAAGRVGLRLACARLRGARRRPRGVRELRRRAGLRALAERAYGIRLPAAERGRMGIRSARGHAHRAVVGRRDRARQRQLLRLRQPLGQPLDRTGRELRVQRLRPLRHARQRLAVRGRLLEREPRRPAAGGTRGDDRQLQRPAGARRRLGQRPARACAPATATGAVLATATTTRVSASCACCRAGS